MFLVFRAFVSHPQDFLCVFICVVSFAFFSVVVCAGVLDMFTCYALSYAAKVRVTSVVECCLCDLCIVYDRLGSEG